MLREYPIIRKISPMGQITVDLRPHIEAKEARTGEKLTVDRMAYEMRLAYNTVKSWMRGSIKQVDIQTLATFCDYFEVEPGDILKYEADSES